MPLASLMLHLGRSVSSDIMEKGKIIFGQERGTVMPEYVLTLVILMAIFVLVASVLIVATNKRTSGAISAVEEMVPCANELASSDGSEACL